MPYFYVTLPKKFGPGVRLSMELDESVISALTPSMHKPVPMGARVKIPPYYFNADKEIWGTVEGVSWKHVIFIYIVVLDERIETDDLGSIKAVTVSGPELEGEDGLHWRVDAQERAQIHGG